MAQVVVEQRIKIVDMQRDMISEAFQVASEALSKHEIDQEVARHIKQHFDRKYYQSKLALRRRQELHLRGDLREQALYPLRHRRQERHPLQVRMISLSSVGKTKYHSFYCKCIEFMHIMRKPTRKLSLQLY